MTVSLLLVDDSPDIGLLVQCLSRRAGHTLVWAETAQEGWQALQEYTPDLLLLDLNLPGENGLTLCARVRASPQFSSLRVALLAHVDRPHDISLALQAGVDYVVSKELLSTPEKWQLRIEELLRPIDSRPFAKSLGWTAENSWSIGAAAWTAAFHRAFCSQVIGRLGPEIARLLLLRAVTALDGHLSSQLLQPGGLGLEAQVLVRLERPGLIAELQRAFTEQLWRVAGSAAGASFMDALAAGSPLGTQISDESLLT